jgi:hypothetical protein
MVTVRLLMFLTAVLFSGCSTTTAKELYVVCGRPTITSLGNNGGENCKSPSDQCQELEFRIGCDVYRW